MRRTSELKIRLEKSDMELLVGMAKRQSRSVSEMGAVIVMDWLHGAVRSLEPIAYESDVSLTKARRNQIIKRDKHTCQLCGKADLALDDCHIDHIKQRHQGGGNDEANLRLTCVDCNQRRPRGANAR